MQTYSLSAFADDALVIMRSGVAEPALLEQLGFEVVANEESEALDERLFRGRADGLCANPENAVVHARLPA